MTQQLIDRLKEIVGEEFVKENENMAKHCTFKCGGNVALYACSGSMMISGSVRHAERKMHHMVMMAE